MEPIGSIENNLAWSEIIDYFGGPLDTESMKQQYMCHDLGQMTAPVFPDTWDLEVYRPSDPDWGYKVIGRVWADGAIIPSNACNCAEQLQDGFIVDYSGAHYGAVEACGDESVQSGLISAESGPTNMFVTEIQIDETPASPQSDLQISGITRYNYADQPRAILKWTCLANESPGEQVTQVELSSIELLKK